MKYQEAILESLNRKWKVGTCGEGEQCWCRTITCDPPLMYSELENDYEFYVIDPAVVTTKIVEHIVKIHNKHTEVKNESL